MFRKSKARIISDAICGVVLLCAILAFILIVAFTGKWHPTWVILPCAIVFVSIVTIVVNALNRVQTDKDKDVKEAFDKKNQK